MVFDFKKANKELYPQKSVPAIVSVPQMVFIAADGTGDPNTSPDYQEAVAVVYGLSYAIKMSKLSGCAPEGYFDYTVAPLEGFWSLPGFVFTGGPILNKDQFSFTTLIRQPDFITEDVFKSAKASLQKKKPGLNVDRARLFIYEEGLCAQILHLGPYDDEPATIERLNAFIAASGYQNDMTDLRRHHEIYLGDPRKTAPEKLKTILRHPIRP